MSKQIELEAIRAKVIRKVLSEYFNNVLEDVTELPFVIDEILSDPIIDKHQEGYYCNPKIAI